ncbi:hypothetical protein BD626DRAFT_635682 [Schizophyllum amplum]|uniref:F-box domain-containing protein n=1 Tax=Schizophyllum amplum TaxID=97359 RepID=A0A550BVL8_9AGAR|nr:hypothetical protein BD626DRAFT_635682 [Auriculariopsis ampla]
MRSTRAAAISATSRLRATAHDDGESGSLEREPSHKESDDGESAPPPRKRGKKTGNSLAKTKKARRGKKRELSAFMDLPLEIHLEIYSYVGPKDLLYLSRTSKNIRTIIMGQSARFLWKHSFARVKDLPPVHFKLNEAQYASLMYERICEYCRAYNAGTIAWCIGVRCCKKCLNQFFYKDDELPMLPSPTETTNIWHEMSDLVPGVDGLTMTGDRRTFYPRDTIDGYVAEAEQIASQDEWEEWFEHKLKLRKITETNIQPYVDWEKACQERGANERDKIRNQRLKFIRARLTCIGYRYQIEFLDKHAPKKLEKHKALRKTHELSDATWPEVADDLIAFMEDVRANWWAKYYKGTDGQRKLPKSFLTPGLLKTSTMAPM